MGVFLYQHSIGNFLPDADARFVIFTSTPEQMKNYWLCHYFPVMMADASSFNDIKNLLEQAGFNTVKSSRFFVTNKLEDMFLHSGKYRPELYLNPQVREGISSFHISADQSELEKGLNSLEIDIKSGKIKKIIENFESDSGDYLFIIGEK